MAIQPNDYLEWSPLSSFWNTKPIDNGETALKASLTLPMWVLGTLGYVVALPIRVAVCALRSLLWVTYFLGALCCLTDCERLKRATQMFGFSILELVTAVVGVVFPFFGYWSDEYIHGKGDVNGTWTEVHKNSWFAEWHSEKEAREAIAAGAPPAVGGAVAAAAIAPAVAPAAVAPAVAPAVGPFAEIEHDAHVAFAQLHALPAIFESYIKDIILFGGYFKDDEGNEVLLGQNGMIADEECNIIEYILMRFLLEGFHRSKTNNLPDLQLGLINFFCPGPPRHIKGYNEGGIFKMGTEAFISILKHNCKVEGHANLVLDVKRMKVYQFRQLLCKSFAKMTRDKDDIALFSANEFAGESQEGLESKRPLYEFVSILFGVPNNVRIKYFRDKILFPLIRKVVKELHGKGNFTLKRIDLFKSYYATTDDPNKSQEEALEAMEKFDAPKYPDEDQKVDQ